MSAKQINIKNKLRFLDILVVIFFLSIAAFFVNQFWLDLMMTINLKNETPVGTVVLKRNTVQRRHAKRVLWDRISYESPVYIGNLIRVADASAANLNIGDSSLDLNENTLVRILRSEDGEGIRIVLNEGSISFSAGSEENIVIDLNGKQVLASAGTVLSAAAGDNGRFLLQVNQGSASFVGEGRVITSGMAIAMDSAGNEVMQRMVVVTSPAPNARYLKNSSDPFAVNFSWNRINLEPSQSLRLEIARDRNFDQIFRTVDNLDNRAQVLLDSSAWFWRLSLEDTVFTAGNLTIADGDLQLESPSQDSLFFYQDELPAVNFFWAQAEDAVSYTIEISSSPDFDIVNIRYNSTAAFYAATLGEGEWYWRVMPIFPLVYQGASSFSRPASFRVEQGAPEVTSLAGWLASLYGVEPEPVVVSAPPAPVVPAVAPVVSQPRVVQPPPLLPAPQNLSPAANALIRYYESMREIAFRWSPVAGANAYIFTLYRQNASGRQQIVRSTVSGTSFTMTNLSLLDGGSYVWQVEAVNTRNGVVQQNGRVAQSVFDFDFETPLPVQIEDTGILYGN